MNISNSVLDGAVTLTKVRQRIGNRLKTTAVFRRWNNGRLEVHETAEYDPNVAVYCETMVSNGPVDPLCEVGDSDFAIP